MSVSNCLAAKVMGEILSEGMSLSGVDLSGSVKSEAIDALCEIQSAVLKDGDDSSRLSEIEKIMEKYMLSEKKDTE